MVGTQQSWPTEASRRCASRGDLLWRSRKLLTQRCWFRTPGKNVSKLTAPAHFLLTVSFRFRRASLSIPEGPKGTRTQQVLSRQRLPKCTLARIVTKRVPFGELLSGLRILSNRLKETKSALIDLKEEIKGRPFFPVKNYSIKSVAPVCGFNWSQADVDGQSAQLMYLDWLKSGDDTIIRRVEQYNREDVLAMLAVDQFVCGLPTGK